MVPSIQPCLVCICLRSSLIRKHIYDASVTHLSHLSTKLISQEIEWNLCDVIEFLKTWSGYNTFMTNNPESEILLKLEKDLSEILEEKKLQNVRFLDQYTLVMMKKM